MVFVAIVCRLEILNGEHERHSNRSCRFRIAEVIISGVRTHVRPPEEELDARLDDVATGTAEGSWRELLVRRPRWLWF